MINMSYYNRHRGKKSFTDIIIDGLILFKDNYLIIVLPLFITSVIPIVFNVILTNFLDYELIKLEEDLTFIMYDFTTISQSDMNLIMQYFLLTFLDVIIENSMFFTFQMFGMALIGYHLYKKFTGKQADLIDDMKHSLNYKLIPVILILGPLMSVGLILVLGFFIYLLFTYNMPEFEENYISKSWKIGTFLRRLLIYLIPVIIINWILDGIYTNILNILWNVDDVTYFTWIANNNFGMLILYRFVYAIARALLFTPLFICLLTSRFAYDLEEYKIKTRPQDYLPKTTEGRKRRSFQMKEGMYCPFCGAFLTQKKNFCPKCGESLEFRI